MTRVGLKPLLQSEQSLKVVLIKNYLTTGVLERVKLERTMDLSAATRTVTFEEELISLPPMLDSTVFIYQII